MAIGMNREAMFSFIFMLACLGHNSLLSLQR